MKPFIPNITQDSLRKKPLGLENISCKNEVGIAVLDFENVRSSESCDFKSFP